MFLHFFCSTWINLNDCDDMIILPLMNIMYMYLWYFYICIWLRAQWLCDCFSQIHKSLNVIVKSGPVKSLLRDPSLEENTSFFLKWFCCYLRVYLLQPGYILSANKLAPLPGNESAYLPWENDKAWRNISVGKQEFRKPKEVVYLP